MSSHTVRDMTVCDICQGIARKSTSILQGKKHFHGRCFIAQWGLDALLSLPTINKECLTLGDIGVKAMRALVESRKYTGPSGSMSAECTICGRPFQEHNEYGLNCPSGFTNAKPGVKNG